MSESATELMEKSLPQSESNVAAKESKTTSKEPVKSEDNILSQEEIESLEKKENKIKGGFLGKIFKNSHSSGDNNPGVVTTKQQYTNTPETDIERLEKDLSTTSSRIESVSMSVEKIEGKLESERAVASGIEERISHLTEEIGELRSMILDRERGFNEIETSFKKIEAMTEEIQPQAIKRDLDRKEREIIDITVKIERLEAVSSETNKQIKLFREQMDKIRSLDNLLKVSKDIEENIAKIKDTEKYTDRMAAKTEELFTELDKRLSQFVSHTARIESLDELTKDLMKSQDKNEIKLKEAVFKEDLEKLKNSVISSVNENIKKEISGDNSNIGRKLEDACRSAAEAKETVTRMSSDEKTKTQELSDLKATLKAFESQLKDLKSQSEIQDIETRKRIENISTGTSAADKTPTNIINKNQDLPEIFSMISEKKIKEVRKEMEEISNSMRCLNSSISDLKKNSLAQMNNIMDIKRYQDNLPIAIENKIIEKTSDLKTNMAMMTELLAQFQKNKVSEKQDIDSLRESLTNIEKNDKLRFTLIDEKNISKNNDLELVKKELSSLDSKIIKEIEHARKDDEISRIELEKALKKEIAKSENSNKDLRQISDTVADLEDNMNYMKDTMDSAQLDNDNIKTAIDAKIISSMKDMRKELEELRTEKEGSRQELEKDSSKIEDLDKKIAQVFESVTDIKDSLRYMRESIDSTNIESDYVKSAVDAKISEKIDDLKKEISEISAVKKEIMALRTEKGASDHELEEDSSKIEELGKKITQISASVALLKNNAEQMKESIHDTLQENKSMKSAADAKISEKIYDLKKDNPIDKQAKKDIEISKKIEFAKKELPKKDMPGLSGPDTDIQKKTKIQSIPKSIPENRWPATEGAIPAGYDPFEDTAAMENIPLETLKLDEYDLRLNKIIRLIGKTEESLKKNNFEDAKISYYSLKTAYNAVYKKVPKYQIDEIRPKIDRLENLLEKK